MMMVDGWNVPHNHYGTGDSAKRIPFVGWQKIESNGLFEFIESKWERKLRKAIKQ